MPTRRSTRYAARRSGTEASPLRGGGCGPGARNGRQTADAPRGCGSTTGIRDRSMARPCQAGSRCNGSRGAHGHEAEALFERSFTRAVAPASAPIMTRPCAASSRRSCLPPYLPFPWSGGGGRARPHLVHMDSPCEVDGVRSSRPLEDTSVYDCTTAPNMAPAEALSGEAAPPPGATPATSYAAPTTGPPDTDPGVGVACLSVLGTASRSVEGLGPPGPDTAPKFPGRRTGPRLPGRPGSLDRPDTWSAATPAGAASGRCTRTSARSRTLPCECVML